MGRVNRKVQLIILLVLVCLVGTMSIAYAILSTMELRKYKMHLGMFILIM